LIRQAFGERITIRSGLKLKGKLVYALAAGEILAGKREFVANSVSLSVESKVYEINKREE